MNIKIIFTIFLFPLLTYSADEGIQNHLEAAFAAKRRIHTERLVMKKECADFIREDENYQNGIAYLASLNRITVESELKSKIDPRQYWQAIKSKTKAPLVVAPHPIAEIGYGVFTTQDLPKGTFVTEYLGEIKPLTDRNAEYAWNLLLSRPSILYPETRETEMQWGWTERENSPNLYIDGARGGNIATLINHNGENSNCTEIILHGKDKLPHVCFLAKKRIPAGEEIAVNYGNQYRLPNGDLPFDLGIHNILEQAKK